MCLAVAGRLMAIDGNRGAVEIFGVRREARLETLDDPRVGDWVLVHAGFAIERIDAESAAMIDAAWRAALAGESERP